MELITRTGKGSKLTIEEMDNNLLYIEDTALNNSGTTLWEIEDSSHIQPIDDQIIYADIIDNLPNDVYIGDVEPTDTLIKIWIDTSAPITTTTTTNSPTTTTTTYSPPTTTTTTHSPTTTTTTTIFVPIYGGIKYGRLYNWYAATDIRGIAPIGWHVPNNEEIDTLTTYLGGPNAAGGKLKEIGTIHWNTPNESATNETEFTALPNGQFGNNTFQNIGDEGRYWSSNTSVSIRRFDWGMDSQFGYIGIYTDYTEYGYAIRLIKDNSINEGDIIIDGDTYNSITIGDQVWLQQSLAVTHYQNGDLIGSDFSGTTGAVTAYDGNESNVYYVLNSGTTTTTTTNSPTTTTTTNGGTTTTTTIFSQNDEDMSLTLNTPLTISVGQTISGVTNAMGDRDWYKTTLTQGTLYNMFTGTPNNVQFDTILYLMDSNGVLLTHDDGGSVNNYSKIVYTPNSSGIYYIVVGTYNDQYIGNYTLTLT